MFIVVLFFKTYKNVNVTTIMFLMSGDLTGLCLYICGKRYQNARFFTKEFGKVRKLRNWKKGLKNARFNNEWKQFWDNDKCKYIDRVLPHFRLAKYCITWKTSNAFCTNLSIWLNPDSRINQKPNGRICKLGCSVFYLFGHLDPAVWTSLP